MTFFWPSTVETNFAKGWMGIGGDSSFQ